MAACTTKEKAEEALKDALEWYKEDRLPINLALVDIDMAVNEPLEISVCSVPTRHA